MNKEEHADTLSLAAAWQAWAEGLAEVLRQSAESCQVCHGEGSFEFRENDGAFQRRDCYACRDWRAALSSPRPNPSRILGVVRRAIEERHAAHEVVRATGSGQSVFMGICDKADDARLRLHEAVDALSPAERALLGGEGEELASKEGDSRE